MLRVKIGFGAVFGVLVVLLACVPAEAGCGVYQQHYHKAVAATPVLLQPLIPLVFGVAAVPAVPVVPAVPAAPVQPPGSATPTLPGDANLAAELARLREEINRLKAGGGNTAALKVSVTAKRCATCHTGAAESGGGTAMFAGGEFAGTDRLRLRAINRVNDGTMPPASAGELSDKEASEAIAEISGSVKK